MLDHFQPDGSHIPVMMTLFAQAQAPKSTSHEEDVSYDTSHDVSRARALPYSGARPGDGLLSDWWAVLVGGVTRWLGRSERHGIDSCDPSGA